MKNRRKLVFLFWVSVFFMNNILMKYYFLLVLIKNDGDLKV